MNTQELCRELAVHLYAQEKLSFGQARELAGLSAWEFQQLLGSRGIDAHYGPDDYEQDLQTLRDLGRL
jgi:predicted HTH domain antitoxin